MARVRACLHLASVRRDAAVTDTQVGKRSRKSLINSRYVDFVSCLSLLQSVQFFYEVANVVGEINTRN